MSSRKRNLILLSPLLVIACGHLFARVCVRFLGAWTWLPLMLVYWALLLGCVLGAREWPLLVAAYKRPSGRPWWLAGLAVGLLPLPLLLLHGRLLRDPLLTCLWLLVAVINPFFEESYWRGLLGEATGSWPAWAACLYSSLLFTASHPLMWGVFSVDNRNWQAWASLLVMGLVWSAAYRNRRSLRAVTASHALVDLCNLSVFAFLNLYLPRG